MSDNIKLVIEIPKNYLETIKHTVRSTTENGNTPLVFEIIANGTPLSEVLNEIKEEIEQTRTLLLCGCNVVDKDDLLKIIDKHIGEENE